MCRICDRGTPKHCCARCLRVVLLFAFLSSECIYIATKYKKNSTHEHNALKCKVWVCAHRIDDSCSADAHANIVSQQNRRQVAPKRIVRIRCKQATVLSYTSWTTVTRYKTGACVCGEKNESKLCQIARIVIIPKYDIEMMHCDGHHITTMYVAG